MMLNRCIGALLLSMTVLFVAGCEQQPPESGPETVRTVSFSLADLNGKQHSLADYRGKWVVVNYWATWCPPCLEELPELDLFYQAHKDTDAVVWGINSEEIGVEELKDFIQEYKIRYPMFQVPPDSGSPLGAVPAIPTTFLVSPEGEVVARRMGGLRAKQIEEFIEQRKGG